MLHMHQLRDFIDDRYSYYRKYYHGEDPRFYHFKGMQNAFVFGSAVDLALKLYYTQNKNDTNIYNTTEFQRLNKTDKIKVLGLVNSYIDCYSEEKFHSFKVQEFRIPFQNYILIGSPDLLAETYIYNDLCILEVKTSTEGVGETLDFQTMFYCWASWRWNYKVPKYVIKRTIMKPRIKQKKNEEIGDYHERLMEDVLDHKKYFKSNIREINKEMCIEFERYLNYIIKDLKQAKHKYAFYKKTKERWP